MSTHKCFCGLQSNVFDAVSLFQTSRGNEMHHVRIFILCSIMTFLYHAMFIHNNHGYLQEERLLGILHLKNHSEFVLIIFYPQLVNSSMLIVLWQTNPQ